MHIWLDPDKVNAVIVKFDGAEPVDVRANCPKHGRGKFNYILGADTYTCSQCSSQRDITALVAEFPDAAYAIRAEELVDVKQEEWSSATQMMNLIAVQPTTDALSDGLWPVRRDEIAETVRDDSIAKHLLEIGVLLTIKQLLDIDRKLHDRIDTIGLRMSHDVRETYALACHFDEWFDACTLIVTARLMGATPLLPHRVLEERYERSYMIAGALTDQALREERRLMHQRRVEREAWEASNYREAKNAHLYETAHDYYRASQTEEAW